MSIKTYTDSMQVASLDVDFDALIMAAFRKADDVNYYLLKLAFPLIEKELKLRYNVPGGQLYGDE